ncbi:NAD-dependent protein lipoamidase sirtuin-4, mitochondrial-like [Mytilus californianus]|uniref:NAD-dependent protein lipoamidase sirtuin-4, mitochondrial-like n=1 Tax=Mytilus californianus TaxID=6549 RepID=UPI0022451A1F|nr:NAD-dependent protein lipoamidase sirtuin-4, mitochondrial-like [Mytilus californianus]
MYSPKKYDLLIKHLRRYSVLGTAHYSCVPPNSPANETDVKTFKDFIEKSKKLLVITGAGVSTESGLPDYNTKGVKFYAGLPYGPVKHQDFIDHEKTRREFWAYHFLAWPTFSSLLPNRTHKILSEWERKGKLHWLVTQNVDALHAKAGSKRLTELHGRFCSVECLDCKNVISRREFQELIKEENTDISEKYVKLNQEQINGFKVPSCKNKKCGGVLKPDIVFYGDYVPKDRVEFVSNKLTESDSLLVLGSSLEVPSAYRFVEAAYKQEKPIGIVNIGPTKADKLANIKISTKCSEILDKI